MQFFFRYLSTVSATSATAITPQTGSIRYVIDPGKERRSMRALRKQFPDARINIDPNGVWSLDEAISLCKDMHDVITYVEDPCGPETGCSGREIMREFKNATQFQVAANMIATDWRQFYHTVSLNACDIILAAPHFWGFDGAVRLNMELVMEANALYQKLPGHDRDDAMAMQHLIPNWKYDHKKPCLVR